MMLGGRRPVRWRLLLFVAVTAVIVTFLFYPQNQEAGALVQALVVTTIVAVGATGLLWTRSRPSPAATSSLEPTVDELAKQLRRQWDRASMERGLTYPEPIPVQWRWSSQPVTGPRAEAVAERLPPLPGKLPVTVKDLQSGALRDLFSVFSGLGSGRLVLLGEQGAGKSGAGIRLLRDVLAYRDTLTAAEDRSRIPLPVLVSPQGWDPASEEPFAEWLAERLARDYGLRRAPEYGEDVAMRLIEEGRLAVILDGLDEMPEALRSDALRALDEQVTFRLVVLTRSEDLVTAVRGGGHLRGAAALELLPTDSGQAANYLASCRTDPLPAPWQRLIDHLNECPDGVLAQALSTPLTLGLVRDTYGPEEGVDELTDGNRFRTLKAVQDHLLDRLLTAAYLRRSGRPAPRYTAEQAQRWLGHLARRMNQESTGNLAWWLTPRWLPAWPRALATVVVISLICTLLVEFLVVLAAHVPLLAVFRVEPLTALATVLSKTLGFGFMFGAGLLLMSPTSGGSPQQRAGLRWTRIVATLLLGLGVGFGFGLERRFAFGFDLEIGLMGGLVSGVVVAIGFFLGGGPPQQLGWLRWSKTDTRTNLHTGLVIGLTAGLVAGLGYGLLQGLMFGLVYGFIVGIGYLLVIIVGGRRFRQQSRLRWSRLDTPTTLLIGLVIATVTTGGYGIIYVFIVILSERPPLERSRLRWSKTDTPRTLLSGLAVGLMFGLLYGLVYGLVYRLTTRQDYWLGLRPGIVLGIVFGLTVGLLLGLRQPPTEDTSLLGPRSSWRRELQFGLVFGLVFEVVSGAAGGFVNGLMAGNGSGLVPNGAGLVSGVAGGLVFGLGSGLLSSATWTAALAGVQLWRRGEAPLRLLRFLDDARERQILRTVGPVYQFRDTRLKDRLANHPPLS